MSERIGPYAIDRELGKGGMGRVFAARVAEEAPGFEIGDTVALKVVHPHLIESPGFLERFVREAQLGASVRHANVVRTFACEHGDPGELVTTSGEHCFMVMEYVQGQTLAALQDELERVPEELCRHVAREVCRGLVAIHEAGIVHRDVKPENVLITPEHEVKLMDLGVALLRSESIRLSQSGAFVGSVEYAAPEQFRGADVDGRTDLFSLGILLYEIAGGTHPHRGGGFHEVLRRVVDDDPRPLGEVNPQLSPFFEEMVHTLMVKDPRGRFASAAQLLTVLEEGEDSDWWHERSRARTAETRRPLRRIRIPRETSVHGRDKELAQLRDLYDKAAAGNGQVVLIAGEAGIGKSRLVDELIARLQADGEDVNFLFGSYPPNGAATATGAFASAFREQFGEPGSAEHLPRMPSLVPAFDALLRGDLAPPGAERLTRESVPTCFVNATRSLAEERVTIVFIDDLHFAPEDGLALFTALAMAVTGHRVLLVGATRPVLYETWESDLDRYDFVTRLEPRRLSAKDLVGLLEDTFKSKALAETLGLQIIVKSDGNPFFAFEIIRGLREGQFIQQRADGSWAGTGGVIDISIPSSVLDLVGARVADLSEDERDLLDVACCWGYEFDPGLVGEVLGISRIPLLKRFGQIERRHRLVRSAGRHYVFDHHQVQEALYGSLHVQLREAFHLALAESYEARHVATGPDADPPRGDVCVALADHYLRGAGGQRALTFLPAAHEHLREGYRYAEVIELVERALAVPGLLAGIERAVALVELARPSGALDLGGRRERQEACARSALALAEAAADERMIMKAEQALGWALARVAEHAESERLFRRMLSHAEALADVKYRSRAESAIGVALWSQGEMERALPHLEAAVELSREIGDVVGESGATGNIGGLLLALGRVGDAREMHERHLALAQSSGDRAAQAGANVNLANVSLMEGRLDEARERCENALEGYNEVGDRRHAAVAAGSLGNVYMVEGRYLHAREQYERLLEISRETGDPEGEVRAIGNLGSVQWSLGRLAEAQFSYERYAEASRAIGYRQGEAMAHHNLGAVARDLGDAQAAEAEFTAGLLICVELGDVYLEAVTRLALGSLWAESDPPRAQRSVRAALAVAEQSGFPGTEVLARCELACLDAAEVDAALALFESQAERLDASEARDASYLLWRCTGERAHLDAARRHVEESAARVDRSTREAMLSNLRVNREVVAACDRLDAEPDSRPAGESPTRSA